MHRYRPQFGRRFRGGYCPRRGSSTRARFHLPTLHRHHWILVFLPQYPTGRIPSSAGPVSDAANSPSATVSTDRSREYNKELVLGFDDVEVSFLKMVSRKWGLYVIFRYFYWILSEFGLSDRVSYTFPVQNLTKIRPLLVTLYELTNVRIDTRSDVAKLVSAFRDCGRCWKGSFVWKSCVICERKVIGHVCVCSCSGLWVCSNRIQREKDRERVVLWLRCQLLR
jgi:hypothetical protein